jgi:hypothetical protein
MIGSALPPGVLNLCNNLVEDAGSSRYKTKPRTTSSQLDRKPASDA